MLHPSTSRYKEAASARAYVERLLSALMIAVGLLACAVPAIRALRIQATEALRESV